MRLQAWHVVTLMGPLLVVLGGFVLYWIIRLAVRAGIADADGRRGGGSPAGDDERGRT